MDQLTVVGDRAVVLPRGVTAAEWALERNRYQNARIRTLLGAIGLLERVLDSNVAILHCSPARAREIWQRLREVADIVQNRLGGFVDDRFGHICRIGQRLADRGWFVDFHHRHNLFFNLR